MSWEAVQVLSTKIPETAWMPPTGYTRWVPTAADTTMKK
jgi:hypothetical protein